MIDESDDAPDVVETARKEFFAALGEAIAEWYWVELRLFYMISRLLGFKDIKAAGAAFSAVVNFNARLQMVESAFQTAIQDEELRAEWRRLHRRLKKHARKRNGIAHLTVITFPQIEDPDMMVYLSHSFVDGSKNPIEPVYLLKDLRQMTKDFHQLMHDFQSFVDRLPP